MQQAFGAKVTTLKFENKIGTYAVFLKKTANRDQKISLFNNLKKLVSTEIWTNENIDFIIIELTLSKKKYIQNNNLISYIGEVQIDLNKLNRLMTGDFSLAEI
jgi:hypothetical protein